MTATRPVLLVTRPEAASRRFLAQFRARFGADWPAVVAPLSRTEFLSPDAPSPKADAVIFTSENAVRGYVELARTEHLPAWCVGPRTAEVARALGFPVTVGPGDAAGLADFIAAAPPGVRLLWPRGEEVAVDIAALLTARGLTVLPMIVYRQQVLPITAEARATLANTAPVVVPLFSPRSARLFADVALGARAALAIAALSPIIAAVAAGLAPAALRVAARPDSGSLLDALGQLLTDVAGG